MKNLKVLFLCLGVFFLMSQIVYASNIYRTGLGFQATAGAGSPLGLMGVEGNLSWNYFDFCLGIGGGITGIQYSTMVRFYPKEDNEVHIGTGPSFSYHKGHAKTEFIDTDTGETYGDIEVKFNDNYSWWNFEIGFSFFNQPEKRQGLTLNITAGTAYLFHAKYRTLDRQVQGLDLTDLTLVSMSNILMQIQRPILDEHEFYPYVCASAGYHF